MLVGTLAGYRALAVHSSSCQCSPEALVFLVVISSRKGRKMYSMLSVPNSQKSSIPVLKRRNEARCWEELDQKHMEAWDSLFDSSLYEKQLLASEPESSDCGFPWAFQCVLQNCNGSFDGGFYNVHKVFLLYIWPLLHGMHRMLIEAWVSEYGPLSIRWRDDLWKLRFSIFSKL